MKLYREIEDKMVLAKVLEMIKETQKHLIVSKREGENHKVKPNEEYYKILQMLSRKGIKISRYFYGSRQGFAQEQNANPDIENIYGGTAEEYQRLIIADGKKSMAKIGRQFVSSENTLWINMLKHSLPK